MCLGIPGRVVERYDERGTAMAVVDFGGVTKAICLAFAPEAAVGDHVIVHAGIAIAVVDEESARTSLDVFEELGLVRSDDAESSP